MKTITKKNIVVFSIIILMIFGVFMFLNSNQQMNIQTDLVNSPIKEPVIARIDFITKSPDVNPLFKIYIDGSEIPEEEPTWLSKLNSHGYVAQKNDGKIHVRIDIIKDVDINVYVRGKHNTNENKEIVDHQVDLISFVLNNNELLLEKNTIWYNKPFKHVIHAKAGETYNVEAKWQKSTQTPQK